MDINIVIRVSVISIKFTNNLLISKEIRHFGTAHLRETKTRITYMG